LQIYSADQGHLMAVINPAKFIRQVRSETARVTWPTRKETFVSAAMVVVIAIIASVIFLLVDWAISSTISSLLGLGG
jgi:preprotein translocase subunit SecE